MGSRLFRWFLRRLSFAFFRLRVSGLEHIPAQGPVILAANHPNLLDGILLQAISPRPVRFLVTEEMYYHKFLNGLFRLMGCIPVFRTRASNGQSLRAAIDALENGHVLGIFPEGTTADLGRMRKVRPGVALLALKTGAPIVPVGFWGSADAYPADERLPRPGRITVAFESPFHLPRWQESDTRVAQESMKQYLDAVRWHIFGAMRSAQRIYRIGKRPSTAKAIEIIISSLIVLPLAALLRATSNPSLE